MVVDVEWYSRHDGEQDSLRDAQLVRFLVDVGIAANEVCVVLAVYESVDVYVHQFLHLLRYERHCHEECRTLEEETTRHRPLLRLVCGGNVHRCGLVGDDNKLSLLAFVNEDQQVDKLRLSDFLSVFVFYLYHGFNLNFDFDFNANLNFDFDFDFDFNANLNPNPNPNLNFDFDFDFDFNFDFNFNANLNYSSFFRMLSSQLAKMKIAASMMMMMLQLTSMLYSA